MTFSNDIGRPASVDGRPFLRLSPGETGHAVHGPYEPVLPGRYEACFPLALAEPGGEGDARVCAVLDVAAADGAAILARRDVTVAELTSFPRDLAVGFSLHAHRTLEYRVYCTGEAELLAGDPRLVPAGEAGPEPPVDVDRDTTDPLERQRQARALLRLLRPQRAQGVAKARLGPLGPVVLDDWADGDAMIVGAAGPPAPPAAAIAVHAWSGGADGGLGGLVRRLDRGGPRPAVVLLPGDADAGALVEAAGDALPRLRQIVCTVDGLDRLAEAGPRRALHAALSRLAATHAVVHLHADARAGMVDVAGLVLPRRLTVTFAARAAYRLADTDELFPGPLDVSADPRRPDLFLGAFRF